VRLQFQSLALKQHCAFRAVRLTLLQQQLALKSICLCFTEMYALRLLFYHSASAPLNKEGLNEFIIDRCMSRVERHPVASGDVGDLNRVTVVITQSKGCQMYD
jgi:hypothetical protein